MSLVRTGKISSNDQKVDKRVFDKNMDSVDFSDAPWRKRDELAKAKAKRSK